MYIDTTKIPYTLMTDSQAIHRYLHGGAGEVTLASPRSGKAHTYAFLRPRNSRDFPPDTIFVYVVHEGHRMYIGMLSGEDFRLTAKSRFGPDTEAVKGAYYIVKMANRQDVVDTKQMNLYHHNTCCFCGRPLKTTKALQAGIGRKCIAKYNEYISQVPWDGN